MSDLRSELDRQRGTERAQAIRALLARPLLTRAADPDDFFLVARHAAELVPWFEAQTGWRLSIEARQGYARLAKVSATPDGTRPARRLRGNRDPFDRRRYALFCMLAAELLPGQVTTIGILAGLLAQATAVEPSIPTFDSASREDRRAYVDALMLLERFGVLTATDGSTDAYLEHADAKVLYRVDATRLARLLAAPQSPSRMAGPDVSALVDEPGYDDDADRLRHAVVRRLLDDPVVYFDALPEAERAYATGLPGRQLIRAAIAEAGLQLEERAEGMLAIDPDAVATDERFPAENSVPAQTALLLLDTILAAYPAPVPHDVLAAQIADRFTEMPAWARTYRSDGGAQRLLTEALAVLERFKLVDGLTARPAAARYAETPDGSAKTPRPRRAR
ncbi:TIGR02678 family protein [Catenuloplanes japonicus]|uniref:TIGR02678 family protein n=1 Tax=Catenuloplanes japonicus TaxID=33876 RepID=UPI0005258A59|nr:TIGR02678 family protein [Catenuloplanes japonicus]